MRTYYAHRQAEHAEMVVMADRLVAEFAGVVTPGTVHGCVARCQERLLKSGLERGLVPATEAAARLTLAATQPAHSDA